MSISSFEHSHHHSGASHRHVSGISGIIAFISAKWSEYRLMRSIESVPYEVMKDVGFPAADRTNEM